MCHTTFINISLTFTPANIYPLSSIHLRVPPWLSPITGRADSKDRINAYQFPWQPRGFPIFEEVFLITFFLPLYNKLHNTSKILVQIDKLRQSHSKVDPEVSVGVSDSLKRIIELVVKFVTGFISLTVALYSLDVFTHQDYNNVQFGDLHFLPWIKRIIYHHIRLFKRWFRLRLLQWMDILTCILYFCVCPIFVINPLLVIFIFGCTITMRRRQIRYVIRRAYLWFEVSSGRARNPETNTPVRDATLADRWWNNPVVWYYLPISYFFGNVYNFIFAFALQLLPLMRGYSDQVMMAFFSLWFWQLVLTIFSTVKLIVMLTYRVYVYIVHGRGLLSDVRSTSSRRKGKFREVEDESPLTHKFKKSKAAKAKARVFAEYDTNDYSKRPVPLDSAKEEMYRFEQGDLLFDSPTFAGKPVPSHLAKIRFEDVEALIGSLTLYKFPNATTDQEAKSLTEIARRLEACRLTWSLCQEGASELRNVLMSIYCELPSLSKMVRADFPKVVPLEDESIASVTYDQSWFKPTKKGFKLEFGSTPNVFHDLIYSKRNETTDKIWIDSHRDRLTVSKLKGMIKVRQERLDQDGERVWSDQQISSWIGDQIPKFSKLKDMKGKHVVILSPWLPPSLYWLKVCDVGERDKDAAYRFFEACVLTILSKLRNNLIQYARTYLNIGSLSRPQKKEFLKSKRQLFINEMRSPQIQQLFLQGVPKKEVVSLIYTEKNNEFRETAQKGPIDDLRAKKKTERCHNVHKARDQKYGYFDDVESTSSLRPAPVEGELWWKDLLITLGYYGFLAFCVSAACELVYRLTPFTKRVIDYFDKIEKFCQDKSEKLDRLIDKMDVQAHATLDEAASVRDDTASMIKSWAKAFTLENMFTTHRHLVMQTSILVQGLVQWLNGDRMCWWTFSHLAVLHSPDMTSILETVDTNTLVFAAAATTCTVVIGGVAYQVSSEKYHEIRLKWTKGLRNPAELELSEDDVQETSGTTQDNVLSSIVSALFNATKLPGVEAARDFNTMYAYKRNVAQEVGGYLETIKCIFCTLCRIFYWYDPLDPFYSEYAQKLRDAIKYADHLSRMDMGVFCKNMARMRETIDEIEKQKEIRIDIQMSSMPTHLKALYVKAFDTISKYADEARPRLRNWQTRVEPVCLLMTGNPGSGKSGATVNICQFLAKMCRFTYGPNSMFYYNPLDAFTEGYHGQPCCVVDDSFKEADKETRMSVAGFIINAVNNALFNMIAAGLEDKGKRVFSSNFLIITTNLYKGGIQHDHSGAHTHLTDPGALFRRYTIAIHRDERVEERALDNTWRVDQCIPFPDMVDKVLTTQQVAELMFACACEKQQKATEYAVPDIEVDQLLADRAPTEFAYEKWFAPDAVIPEHVFVHPDFNEVQPTADPRRPLTNDMIIQQLLDDGYAFFSSGEYTKYYVMGFFFLMMCLLILPWFVKMIPHTEETSKPKKHATGRQTRRGGKNRRKDREIAVLDRVQSTSENLNYQNALLKAGRSVVHAIITVYINKEPWENLGVGTHIKDGWVCLPAHMVLFARFEDKVTVTLTWDTNKITFNFDNYIRLEKEDLVLIHIPNNVARPPSCYKNLLDEMTEDELPEHSTLHLLSRGEMIGVPTIRQVTKTTGCSETKWERDGEMFFVKRPYYFHELNSIGDSGSPVFMRGIQGQAIMIGISVGNTNNRKGLGQLSGLLDNSNRYTHSFAVRFSKKTFDDMVEQANLLNEFELDLSIDDVASELSDAEPTSHLIPMRPLRMGIDPPYFPPLESKICKTPLYGFAGEPTCVPAHLSRENLYKAQKKFNQVPFKMVDIPPIVIEHMRYLYPRDRTTDLGMNRLLTLDEVVNGCEELNITPMCMSTSAGEYGQFGGKGKTPYFRRVDRSGVIQYEMKERCRESYERTLEMAKHGHSFIYYWCDVPKDETLPVEKVLDGKVRVFSTCHMFLSMQIKCAFGAFVGFLQRDAVTKPIAVGINVHSLDWTRMAWHLTEFDEYSLIAGDFSNYDASLLPELMETFLQHANWWYNDDYNLLRVTLFKNITHSIHKCYDVIFQLWGGNPSGNPMTSPLNSYCNCIMTFTIMVLKFKKMPMDVRMTCYGDDHIVCAKREEGEPLITCDQLAPHYKELFNVNYTHWSKDPSALTRVDRLKDIRYLGRAFVESFGIYHAPLKKSTIYEMMYYVKQGTVIKDVMISEAQCFFIEASHYSQEEFDEMSNELVRAVDALPPTLVPGLASAVRSCRQYWFHYQAVHYGYGIRPPIVTESELD